MCASELVFDIICDSKVQVAYVQRDGDMSYSFSTTNECRLKFAKIVPNMLRPNALLKTLLNEHIRVGLKISLSFVDVFIQQCLKLIDVEKQKLVDKDLGINNTSLQFNKYKQRVLGCQTTCPCCGRMCDVEHFKMTTAIGSDTNKHQCLRGHQFRGMIGFKMERSNTPSFRICESMKDEDKIFYSGNCINWKEYKERHPQWSFELDSRTRQNANDWRARCVFIWGKIGKELCERFGLTYTNLAIGSQLKIPDPIHFVLVLDDSSSMAGPRWQALNHSVTNFLQIRYKNGNPEDRVTIIFFSDEASIELFSEKIHPSVVDHLKPKNSGGSNFSAALERVIQTIKDTQKEKDKRKFGIVFMSDGEASYPSTELLELKTNWLNHIYKFWCIGFGEETSRFDVLREMCTFVNGDDRSFMNPQNNTALDTAYTEIARSETHLKS